MPSGDPYAAGPKTLVIEGAKGIVFKKALGTRAFTKDPDGLTGLIVSVIPGQPYPVLTVSYSADDGSHNVRLTWDPRTKTFKQLPPRKSK